MKKTTVTHLDPDHPNLLGGRRKLVRRRTRSLVFQNPSGSGGRRSGPTTPLLRWKFVDDVDAKKQVKQRSQMDKCGRRKEKNGVENELGAVKIPARSADSVSARKLAAGIWNLQKPEVSEAANGVHGRVGFQPVLGHLQESHLHNLKITGHHSDPQDGLPSPASVSSSKNNVFYQREPSVALPNPAMERATKWDPGFSKASEEVYWFYSQLNILEDQKKNASSVVSELRLDVERASIRINELEDECQLSKKKFDHFLRKLAEEKASWRSREHEKVRAIINDMKDELNSERKNRQRVEIINSKLVSELKETKLSARHHLQDCEKERKARELMEEVCDELAKEIGEEKTEVEALRRDSMKIREEVEEERRMLQMAEVWREERVQMKLIDAKLTLEEKYSQMRNLQAELEVFLKTWTGTNPIAGEINEAKMLREAVDMVKIHEIKEFSYQPPHASEDIFSVFEELQTMDEAYDREDEPCYGSSPASRASKIHTVSPEANGISGDPMEKRCVNGSIDNHEDIEEDSGWETISPGEGQGFSNSLDGSDPSINGAYVESNDASISGTDWDETKLNNKIDDEIIELCPDTTKHSKKKISSITRLWKSSRPSNGESCKVVARPSNSESCKVVAADAINGRLSIEGLSNGTLSPDVGCGELGLSSPSIGLWSSPDLLNSHVARGMKGCIEWPRGLQKQSLKSKLLEARMESQKFQLRHVLKQMS